ncbi:metal tolerance protein C1 isoform X2 [Mercurialis annua]|uniref:metal tolerance protein C1 isoform X2 n=1 Tax=Mercurialis annua TaxID=3986 RepID=UPI00215EECEE|nr:metal tolerance protein C1 isoform X2 [Mercurialis annua]
MLREIKNIHMVTYIIIWHGKFESLGALGISCMLLATAGGIAWHALDLLLGLLSASPEVLNHSAVLTGSHGGHHHGIGMDHPGLALSMTIVSISVKEWLYWITKQAGEKQGSGLMKANAWHHRADAISSVVALIGVGGSILGVKFLDPLAGLVVSGMILKAGLESGYQSVLELVDAAIPAELLDPVKQTILQVEGVKGCHHLRGRRAGSSLYLDVHIEVDPFLSVSVAHEIGEKVRKEIHKSHHEIAEAFIHIDPAYLKFQQSMQNNLEGFSYQNRNISLEDKDIAVIVSKIFLSKFQKMEVERITRHCLQGKTILEIQVSLSPDIFIKEATEVAEAAEKEIIKAASDIIQVSIQLRLGRPVPEFYFQ